MRTLAIAVSSAACPLVGCIDTDAAVFVEPSIRDPSASLTVSSLAAGLGGGFTLGLHLGGRASGDSQVDLTHFSVLGADRVSEVLSPLQVATDQPSPVTVIRGGEDTVVTVTFFPDDNSFATGDVGAFCDAAGIIIRGNLNDSLLGATTLVESDPFRVGSCP